MSANDPLQKVINTLSESIGHSWKSLGRELGFPETDLADIEVAYPHDLKERIYQLFYRWRRRNGDNATVEQLIRAARSQRLEHLLPEARLPDGFDVQSAARHAHVFPPSVVEASPIQCQDASVEADKGSTSPGNAAEKPNLTELREKRLRALGQPSQHQKESEISCPTTVTQAKATRLGVGDCAKVDMLDGRFRYGVVQCIEDLDINDEGIKIECAGLLMEDEEKDALCPGSDGTFNGKRYVQCGPGCGLILPLDTVMRDDRFDESHTSGSTPHLAPPTPKAALQTTPLVPIATPLAVTPPVSTLPIASPTAMITPPKTTERSRSTPGPSSPEVTMPRKSYSGGAPTEVAVQQLLKILTEQDCRLEFCFPGDQTGILIGREGKNVKEVEELTQTKISIKGDKNDVSQNGSGVISGPNKEDCTAALVMLLTKVLARINKHIDTRSEKFSFSGRHQCGLVIGREGTTLKSIQFLSGAVVKIKQDNPTDLHCTITGSFDQIEKAKQLINRAMEKEDITKSALVAATLKMLFSVMAKHGYKLS